MSVSLPHTLGPLALQHPRLLSGLLLHTVATTLQDMAGDPQHLGAKMGGFAVLHPWGQPLPHHPHLHGVLPAGGRAAAGSQGGPCRPPCCRPVRVLARRFRRLCLAGLAPLYGRGQFALTGRCRARTGPAHWQPRLAAVRDQAWGVSAKEPLQAPQPVLTYLARSTPRVAISNHRLVALEDGPVTLRDKDYQPGHRLRPLTLDAVACLRRFMLHVPPHGFHRRRHLGCLAHRVRQAHLAQCRTRLGHALHPCAPAAAVDRQAPAVAAAEPGRGGPVCQHGRRQLSTPMYRPPAVWDLSGPAPGLDTS